MRETRLTLLGHEQRKLIDAIAGKSDNLEVIGTSKMRGRSKKLG